MTKNEARKIKVGDRVVMKDSPMEFGTITKRMSDYCWWVLWDNDCEELYILEDDIQPEDVEERIKQFALELGYNVELKIEQ